METWQTILATASLLGIILVNPIGDAIRDNGNKRLQKNFELLREVFTWTLVYAVTGALTFVICGAIAHLSFRVALHNLAYNWSRKPRLPWHFTGSTSLSDELEGIMFKEKLWVGISRLFCLLFGVFLLYVGIKNFSNSPYAIMIMSKESIWTIFY